MLRTYRMAVSIAAMTLVSLQMAGTAEAAIPPGTITVKLEKVTGGLGGLTPLSGNVVDSRPQLAPIDMTPLGDGRQLIMTLNGQVRMLTSGGTLSSGAYLDTKNANTAPANLEVGNTGIRAHPDFLNSGTAGYGKFYTLTTETFLSGTADFGTGNAFSGKNPMVFSLAVCR